MKSALVAIGAAIVALALFGRGNRRPELLSSDIQGTFRMTTQSRARLEKLGFRFGEQPSISFAGDRFTMTSLPACVFDSLEKNAVRAEGRFAFRSAASLKLEFSDPRPFGVICSDGAFSFERSGSTVVLSIVSPELKSDGPLRYERNG